MGNGQTIDVRAAGEIVKFRIISSDLFCNWKFCRIFASLMYKADEDYISQEVKTVL